MQIKNKGLQLTVVISCPRHYYNRMCYNYSDEQVVYSQTFLMRLA